MQFNLIEIINQKQDQPFHIGGDKLISFHDLKNEINQRISQFSKEGLSTSTICCAQLTPNINSIVTLLALIQLGTKTILTNSRWPSLMIDSLIKANGVTHYLQSDSTVTTIQKMDEPREDLSLSTDPLVFIGTSGSSGLPKLAALTLDNLICNALGSNEVIKLQPGDCWSLSLPIFHVGGLGIVFRTLLAGSSLITTDPKDPLTQYPDKITHLSLVPTQLLRLLNERKIQEKLPNLKAILLGGAPISNDMLIRARDILGNIIYPTYGLTEMASQVTTSTPLHFKDTQRHTSGAVVGSALKNRELKINEKNEILVRGGCLFKGYLKEGAIQSALDSDGWFNTKDLGSISSDGVLEILGRADSQFISGGENIHPESIELALSEFPGVLSAVVVPYKDFEFGFRPLAFILTESSVLNLKEIQAYLRQRIPSYTIPTKILIAPPEMVTHSGKLSRALALQLAKEVV